MADVDLAALELELARAELTFLVDATVPEGATQPFGLYAFAADDPRAELGRWVERRVFAQAFGDSPALLREEYGPYEPATFFFVVLDHLRRVPAGVLRLIVQSPIGLKTRADVVRFWGAPADVDNELDERNEWDVASLAVSPEYQGAAKSGMVSLALFQGMGVGAKVCGVDRIVAILDSVVLRFLQSQLHRPFHGLGGLPPLPYLGSASSKPVRCDGAEWSVRLDLADPVLHEIVFEGTGLEPVLRSPDWDEVRALVRELGERVGQAVPIGAAGSR